ncbi:hypothetical protein ACFC09_41215 [Streptomyces sp. NPDC056161]|uniref:hypothetical protein n=1 Tax=Streptomyces sp. NPDC056161 TaxID=3345732 RepID=UPI0035DF3B5E
MLAPSVADGCCFHRERSPAVPHSWGGSRPALTAVALTATALVALPTAAPAATARPAAPDWSTAVVDSTMARYTPSTIGGWSYPVGLYLYGCGTGLVSRRPGTVAATRCPPCGSPR